jgi:hypothetical protein
MSAAVLSMSMALPILARSSLQTHGVSFVVALFTLPPAGTSMYSPKPKPMAEPLHQTTTPFM